ncbi:MAG: hypothetical protein Q9222_006846 [Ikaeria aurantiellina]
MHAKGTTYLDHAGSTTYPRSLIKEYGRVMDSHLFGNPHSQSPSSLLSTGTVETARRRMLNFFHADPDHFDLVFVANATAAIKLVVDGVSGSASQRGFWYGYHADSHTSLVGPRELATAGSRCFFRDTEVSQWFSESLPLQGSRPDLHDKENIGLFAYPAQSNMNGRRLPLDWPGQVRRATAQANREVYSLLDAAAFVATAQLDLSDHLNAPDFTALSFYKIFGFPDLGALIVRKDAGHVLLRRKYFGGGTVDMVINGADDVWHATKQGAIHEALEDGTPAFHSITALHYALDVHTRLYGCMKNVSRHTGLLAAALHGQMSSLTHSNGQAVCTIYTDANSDYQNSKVQGPTIAFNLQTSSGTWIGKSDFERLATLNGIQLRTGGVCNPGGIAAHLQLSPKEMRQNFAEGLRCGNDFDEMNGKPTGIIRVSFGAMSSIKEVVHFMQFMNIFIDKGNNRQMGTQPMIHPSKSSRYTKSNQVISKQIPENEIDECCQHRKVAELQESQQGDDDQTDTLQVSTLRSRCPVAACLATYPSQEQLWKHFESHQLHGRRRWKMPRICTG